MRKLLQIGEVAQLLGVKTKTIRHYHKIGLLQEPERAMSGYRLYSAQDLIRLKQIRHMQNIGLSLKRIKTVLDGTMHEHSLREVLEDLDTELASQQQLLHERCERIHAILVEDALLEISQPTSTSSFEIVKDLLGERLSSVTPAMLEMERQIWLVIDGFDWPADYQEHLLWVARDLAARPILYERLFIFAEKFAALSALSEEAPEVKQLITLYRQSQELQDLLVEINKLSAQLPRLEGPFEELFKNLVLPNVAPAQQRFLAEVESWHAATDPDMT